MRHADRSSAAKRGPLELPCVRVDNRGGVSVGAQDVGRFRQAKSQWSGNAARRSLVAGGKRQLRRGGNSEARCTLHGSSRVQTGETLCFVHWVCCSGVPTPSEKRR